MPDLDHQAAAEAAFERWFDEPKNFGPLPFLQVRKAFMAGFSAAPTPNDEATDEPRPSRSTPNDE